MFLQKFILLTCPVSFWCSKLSRFESWSSHDFVEMQFTWYQWTVTLSICFERRKSGIFSQCNMHLCLISIGRGLRTILRGTVTFCCGLIFGRSKLPILPGLEPGIPWFVVRCLIHWATGPKMFEKKWGPFYKAQFPHLQCVDMLF